MKKWTIGRPDRNIVQKLMTECGISSLTASVLASKGYSSSDSVMDSLEMRELSDPLLIKDMKKAVDTITSAIDNDERICVYGDYDCDGIMSTVILYSYLNETGADVIYYIPERSEGYGLNNGAIEKISELGAKLIVTVDNGISAIDESEYIYSLGMKLVVTDHHQQGEILPRAEAVVDPHRLDCFSPFKYLCGAGVALKLIAAIEGDYTVALEQFGDLAAIATVADIVSLTGENRFLVSYGMELINNTERPSLIAMKEICGIDKKTINARSIGFGIAPRINASGRFGSPKTAAELFLCENYDDAFSMAQELDRLNNERKKSENEIISEIYEMIDKDPSVVRKRVIFICGNEWHHGVIGIVASRIMERFGKPCFIASEHNGEIRGSARSFGNFSVFGALSYASESLEKFGGHIGAGGFTIKNGMKDEFYRLIEEYALENHKIMPVLTVTADTAVSPEEIRIDNIEGLNILEPHGFENEKPLFYIQNAEITEIVPLSEGKHSKLRIKFGNIRLDALVFFKEPSELIVRKNDICDIIATLETNEFRGNTSISIIVNDIRPHAFEQNKYFSALSAFESFMRNEELPENYYKSMLPTRNESVLIYKHIPDAGINSDNLYIKLRSEMNYCKFLVAIESFRQLGLVTVSSSDSVIKRVAVNEKTDLCSAPVIISLKEKISN